jgi:hypothetical protein
MPNPPEGNVLSSTVLPPFPTGIPHIGSPTTTVGGFSLSYHSYVPNFPIITQEIEKKLNTPKESIYSSPSQPVAVTSKKRTLDDMTMTTISTTSPSASTTTSPPPPDPSAKRQMSIDNILNPHNDPNIT